MKTITYIFLALTTPFYVAWMTHETIRLWKAARAYAPKKGAR